MNSFRTRTVNALSWSFASKFTSQAISIVFGIILARLLVPEDFGLIAMIMVMMGFAGLLADVGLGSALIQKIDVNEDHYSSVFWANNVLGLVLAIIMMLLSPLIAAFYKQPELELITIVLSINFMFGALAMVPRARLSKKMAFRELAIIDLLEMFLSGGVAVAMAAAGYGYWSLVSQKIAASISSAILLWVIARWKPKLSYNMAAVKELVKFSFSVFLTRSLQYISRNISQLLIGKFLGVRSLGLQDKARSMMLFPIQNISHVVSAVMFPSFSQIQGDKDRVRNVYLKLVRAVSLLTFPMMIGMFAVSDTFVLGVLGEQWKEIIPLFRIYCVTGLVTSIVTLTGSIYLSQGAANLQLRINMIIQPLIIVSLVVGLEWGLLGVVIGHAIANYVGAIITWKTAGKLINLKIIEILKNLYTALILSSIMGLLVAVSKELVIEKTPLEQFVFQLLVGVCVYLCLLMIIKPRAYHEIRSVLKK